MKVVISLDITVIPLSVNGQPVTVDVAANNGDAQTDVEPGTQEAVATEAVARDAVISAAINGGTGLRVRSTRLAYINGLLNEAGLHPLTESEVQLHLPEGTP